MNNGTRSSIYAAVAAFLLFTAWDLYKTNDPNSTMTPTIKIIFVVFFAIAGVALIALAWWTWKTRNKPEEKEETKDGNGFK